MFMYVYHNYEWFKLINDLFFLHFRWRSTGEFIPILISTCKCYVTFEHTLQCLKYTYCSSCSSLTLYSCAEVSCSSLYRVSCVSPCDEEGPLKFSQNVCNSSLTLFLSYVYVKLKGLFPCCFT